MSPSSMLRAARRACLALLLGSAGLALGAPAAAAAPRPDVRSAAVLVVDERSKDVIFERRAQQSAPIASITKVMTALVVLEAGQSRSDMIQITRDDRNRTRGSASRLPVGARLSRGDLLHLALMSSENRAAQALARSYPGGLDAALRAMNRRARELGMTRTRFVDPTGLSERNVSTPADLARLVVAAARDPHIRRYSTDREHVVRLRRQSLEYRNTNVLIGRDGWSISLQKTGYISEAGQCLVMRTVIDDRQVVIVLLNSWGKYTRVADARRIRRWMEAGGAEAPARRG
jgi:D-alanyl-D-alanine endopeptidase (penicillin-binding protein 7)